MALNTKPVGFLVVWHEILLGYAGSISTVLESTSNKNIVFLIIPYGYKYNKNKKILRRLKSRGPNSTIGNQNHHFCRLLLESPV